MANLDDFVSASAFPRKLLFAFQRIRRQTPLSQNAYQIVPCHIQFSPTNRCNAKCTWCSCRNVDRACEMPIDEIQEMLQHFSSIGAAAITITGGGEPTLHPDFVGILIECAKRHLAIGLVTNGLLWSTAGDKRGSNQRRAIEATAKTATWVRLSVVDVESGEYDPMRIVRIARLLPSVDIGVSFTVTPRVNIGTAQAIAQAVGNLPNVTHIRYVEEILQGAPEAMLEVERVCKQHTLKGIYQRRSTFTCGARRCLMSKLKPMIDPSGQVFPCCGVQYADGGQSQSMEMGKEYAMGHWREYSLDTDPFDGTRCAKCYYGHYQTLLEHFETPAPKHAAFV